MTLLVHNPTELNQAFNSLGTAASGPETIEMAPGDYSLTELITRRRKFVNVITIKSQDPVNRANVVSGWDCRDCRKITFEQLRTKFFLVRESSSDIIIQKNDIGGYVPSDPLSNIWASGPGSLRNGIYKDGTAPPGKVDILENYIHDCLIGINLGTSGGLTISKNDLTKCFSDLIKVSPPFSPVTIENNIGSNLFGQPSDVTAPHPDLIQFIGGGADWSNIKVKGNILYIGHARGISQGIFFDDCGAGFYFNGTVIEGNIVIGPTTRSISIGQAKDVIVKNNYCAGLVVGTGSAGYSSAGIHTITGNSYTNLSYSGTHNISNNIKRV